MDKIQNAKELGHIVQIAGKDNMVCNGYEENLSEYATKSKDAFRLKSIARPMLTNTQ